MIINHTINTSNTNSHSTIKGILIKSQLSLMRLYSWQPTEHAYILPKIVPYILQLKALGYMNLVHIMQFTSPTIQCSVSSSRRKSFMILCLVFINRLTKEIDIILIISGWLLAGMRWTGGLISISWMVLRVWWVISLLLWIEV